MANTTQVSFDFLRSQVYMGHTCKTKKGKKLTWQKLSELSGLVNVTATKEGINIIYQLV